MRSVSVILFVLVAGIISATMFPSIASAQSVDLTRRADVVVVGRVTELTSDWNSDRSRIYSRVTVTVDEHIKGDVAQSSVTISTPGGEIDGVGEVYSHTARFKTDEQVVLFAAADPQGQLSVVGGDEGKLAVTKDARTGLEMVSDNEPLNAFTHRVRAIVQAQSH
jgi:hypothetical protein